MPIYHYKAVAANGERLEGDMDAQSQTDAINRLQSAGHLPISAEVKSGKTTSPQHFLFSPFSQKDKIRPKDILILTRELATLLNAGLPLDHALRMLEDLSVHAPVKKLVREIHSRIEGGASLSSAMEEQGHVFDRLYLNTIRAGESSGALDVVLTRLADYLDHSAELRSTVFSALLYPAILFFVSILSILVLLIFVIPQFIPLFEDAGQALPLLTQLVLGCAEVIRQYWWVMLTILALVAWIIDRQLKKPDVRLRWDAWCLDVPLYGELITKLEVARMTRTLGTLLLNGVPLLNAVSITREVLSNNVLIHVIDAVAENLEKGGNIARPLLQSGHFPPLVVQLIQVGEETGQIETMLIKIADIYDNESRITINRLLTLIEPILILGLGAVIAIIIVSVLIAILGLNELVI